MNVDLLAANLAAHWIQAGLIAAVSLLALALLRVTDPRLRMAALQATLWLIVLVPWAQPWRMLDEALSYPASAPLPFEETGVAPTLAALPPAAASTIDPIQVALAIVGAGIIVRLSWLAYGGLCLVRFRRTGRAIAPPDLADELQTRMNVSPRYIEHSTPGGPSTFGLFTSTIALPAGFGALEPKFQRAIICHELLHVQRRDTLIAFVEEVLTAALWFHPWMWLIRSRIRVAREQVVDRMVLKLIGDRTEYVRCLIELSGHDLLPHLGTGMLSSHELRARIDAMFQEAHMSRARMIGISIALAAVVGVTSQVAAARVPLQAMTIAGIYPAVPAPPGLPLALPRGVVAPAPLPLPDAAVSLRQAPAPGGRGRGVQAAVPAAPRARTKTAYAEYPLEALEKRIRGTVIVNLVVNAAGDVTSAGVVSGPQELRASAFKAALGLKYAPGPSTTDMTVSVQFLLDPQSWGVRIVDRAAPEDAASLQERLRDSAAQLAQPAGAATTTTGAIRVGGAIRQPAKIKDVRPVYPPIARTARVQGVVIVEATIDAAGNVSDVRVLRSIPLLDQAAVDAVKQWQFEPTLLNGAAVPVIMTATVNFTLSDEVRLRIDLPNGSTTALVFARAGGFAVIDLPGTGQFGFGTAEVPGSSSLKITIYEISNGVQRPIGSVDVAPEDHTVRTATTPSFGIEVARIVR